MKRDLFPVAAPSIHWHNLLKGGQSLLFLFIILPTQHLVPHQSSGWGERCRQYSRFFIIGISNFSWRKACLKSSLIEKRTDIWFEMRISRSWSMGWLSVLMSFHFLLLPVPHKGSPSFLTGLAPYLFCSPLEAGYSWCPTEPFTCLRDFLVQCRQPGLGDSEHLGSPLGQWQER